MIKGEVPGVKLQTLQTELLSLEDVSVYQNKSNEEDVISCIMGNVGCLIGSV